MSLLSETGLLFVLCLVNIGVYSLLYLTWSLGNRILHLEELIRRLTNGRSE